MAEYQLVQHKLFVLSPACSPTASSYKLLLHAVQVKCKSAPGKRPSKGNCAVRMRVTFVFSGGINVTLPAGPASPSIAAQKMITEQGYTCGVLPFNDTLNVLNVGLCTLA